MALVVGEKHELADQRIKAYVAPADVDLKELRRFCDERLSAAKRPNVYRAVAAFETTPSGKIIRTQNLD